MSKLLVRHGLSRANDRNSTAFGRPYAQLMSQGIQHAKVAGDTLVAVYGIDPEKDEAAASEMVRSQQTASVAGFKVVRSYAVLNEVDVPKTPELRAALDRSEVIPEARKAAETLLANPPKEEVWFTHGYLMAAVCELTGFDASGLRFIPRFGEIRELPIE
jgi:bisphosphoglycerate-dependent phosphoglycerate mutase